MSLLQKMFNHDSDAIWTVLNDIRLASSLARYEAAKQYILRMYPENEVLLVNDIGTSNDVSIQNIIDIEENGYYNYSEIDKLNNKVVYLITFSSVD